MPLSAHEQRQLSAIEKSLTAEDPKLAFLLTRWRRPPTSMSIRRRATRARKQSQRPGHRRQIPHRTQAIVLISMLIAAVGTTIALFVAALSPTYVGPEQTAIWLAAYAAIFFAGSYLVINQFDRSIRHKDLGSRLFGIAVALLFCASMICLASLVSSIP